MLLFQKKTSSEIATPTAATEVKIVDVVDSTNDETSTEVRTWEKDEITRDEQNSATAPNGAIAASEPTAKATPANEGETPSETLVVNGNQKE